jgi:NDP-sugar pyrophosphorylase family protein
MPNDKDQIPDKFEIPNTCIFKNNNIENGRQTDKYLVDNTVV